ncbi:hypothetical protein D3C79_646150 [compost metagenome]
MGDRTKHPQAGFRRVAREQHHFHRQLIGERLVDAQEAANERERHPPGERLVQVLFLVLAVSLDTLGLVDVIGDGEVEQRTRGNADDQFFFNGVGHEAAPASGMKASVRARSDESRQLRD